MLQRQTYALTAQWFVYVRILDSLFGAYRDRPLAAGRLGWEAASCLPSSAGVKAEGQIYGVRSGREFTRCVHKSVLSGSLPSFTQLHGGRQSGNGKSVLVGQTRTAGRDKEGGNRPSLLWNVTTCLVQIKGDEV
jgi:hypothetical protein